MKIELPIGQLAKYIEEFRNSRLVDNIEINTSDLGIKVPTLDRLSTVNWFIKKEKLPMIAMTLSNGYEFQSAANHILKESGKDIFAKDCMPGTKLDHVIGQVTVVSICKIPEDDCYDLSIDTPHLYYDANGLVHHNTIMTASLSKSVEQYGRSIVIVPNISLVTQTEADYINMGLDVGVYFGGRKESGKTHTICTWQSLNVLLKSTKAGTGETTIGEFLEGVVCVMVDECFNGQSRVLTPNGYIPIKDINPGDKVINYSEETKEFKVDTVVKQHINLTNSSTEKMYKLEFDNGSIIEVTGNHKFLTNQGWVRVYELTENHEILTPSINTLD
jgi:hypothetical protein